MKRFNLETQAWEEQHEEAPSALGLLQAVYRDVEPLSVRMRAAIESLPYENPRMSAVAVGCLTNDTFAERLDRAIDRSDRAKLIDGSAIEVEDQ